MANNKHFEEIGINIEEQFQSVGPQPSEKSSKSQRPEMKGPSDISDLLSGIKTKNIDAKLVTL